MRHLHISGLRPGLASAAAALLGLTLLASPAGAHLPDRDARATLPVPTTATVTAAQLGPDSVLAVVSHGHFEKLRAEGLERSLEVITPDGVRHPVYTVAVEESRRGWYHGDFTLADWRPELHTALLRVSLGAQRRHAGRVRRRDRRHARGAGPASGRARRARPGRRRCPPDDLPRRGAGPAASSGRPTGTARRPWLTGRSDGAAITSPDGTQLVTTRARPSAGGSSTSWRAPAPPSTPPATAAPHRWFDDDSVVATCSTGRVGSQLRRVALDGSSVTAGHPPHRCGPRGRCPDLRRRRRPHACSGTRLLRVLRRVRRERS